MTKVYVPVSVKDELPNVPGHYFMILEDESKHYGEYEGDDIWPPRVTHWLKEVQLPTSGQLSEKWPTRDSMGNIAREKGAQYILNLLTPDNNEEKQN